MDQHVCGWARRHGDRVACVRRSFGGWLRIAPRAALILAFTAAAASGQSFPAGWTATNVGNPSPAGSAKESNGVFTISGSGARLRHAEEFTFVHWQVTGDVTIVARVVNAGHLSSARAGVMVRDALTPTAPFAMAAATPNRGTDFIARAPSGETWDEDGAAGTPPEWVRLERRGSAVIASRSSDGATWSVLAEAHVGFGAAVHVGLAVMSRRAGTLTTATFDNVALTSGGVPGDAPPSLPRRAVFTPSADHDTTVTHYVLEIFTQGADPATTAPVQTQNLGKPAVVNGECSADIAATIESLPGGTYIATVSAFGSGGSSRSAASAPFTR